MSLELLLSTPHTHGLITLCAMDDPDRTGFLAINQGFKETCDIDPAIAPQVDQLYIGFKVTGMEDYNLFKDDLRADMTKMVKYHALSVLRVGVHQLLVNREIAAVVWNDRPHDERTELGFDQPWPEYVVMVPKELFHIAKKNKLEIFHPMDDESWVLLGNFQWPVAASHVSYEVFGKLLRTVELESVHPPLRPDQD